jgi:3-methyladenine DNA glycosylase AlkD
MNRLTTEQTASIDALIALLDEKSDPVRAIQMAAYMKDKFEFFGIPAPERKKLSKAFIDEHKLSPSYFSIAKHLFNLPHRELHYIAMELHFKAKKIWSENALQEIEWLICSKSWWDTVDFIASNCAGALLLKEQYNAREIAEKWNNSSDFWLVRTSLLFQLKYGEKTDKVLLRDLILPHHDNKEFFIRKAIGWALRQYAKTNPKWVYDFVNKVHLSPLSRKEALKHWH